MDKEKEEKKDKTFYQVMSDEIDKEKARSRPYED